MSEARNFAVLRMSKLSSLQALAGASRHNNRTASSGLDHAEGHAARMGGGVRLLAGKNDAVAAWHSRSQSVGVGKPRKGAVRALELVMSASPAWFSEASTERREAWCNRSVAWAAKTFGQDNILSAYLHDDEQTPHVHVLVIPLAHKSRRKAGRPKKRGDGEPPVAVTTWGLSAADWVGSPGRLAGLQTGYANALADLGIQRGLAKRVTGNRHCSAGAYRRKAAEAFHTAEANRDSAANELSRARTIGSAVLETVSAFGAGLDAVDGGELVYQTPAEGISEGLRRRSVKEPSLPIDDDGFRRWKRAVKPMLSRLIDYARRVSVIASRERKVTRQAKDLEVEAAALFSNVGHQAVASPSQAPNDHPDQAAEATYNRRSRQPALRQQLR